ncbi:E3 UFM1-protein ligase 1 [Halocaridina rubra]|uniref:E3 UFM1-protein ligase 1 homolog n=1 Tax=Halocaridina rubra TaxID=373956 RepID=A0AAN9AG70_HALRR
MSSADWEEVKRLAADFQRAQLSSTLQKLSERNCVEIINKLVELNLIDIYHTNDGKEYVTPAHLAKEIQDEVYVHGGRIEVAELVDILSVDYTVIERMASSLAASDGQLRFTMGQLISFQYMDTIAEEINERLQQTGTTNIPDLVKHYDLPPEVMQDIVVRRLGTIIQGQQDTHDLSLFFTEAFVARHRAHVRGVLSAITRPTQVSTIIAQHGFQQRLFFSVAEKLIESRRVHGILTGNRQIHRAMFIPSIYSRTQNEWVDNFWRQNGYLEFESLRRLDISDPESYIHRRFKDENMTIVGDVCIGQSFIDQIEASLDDALVSGGWVDIYPLLPTSFSPEAGNQLLEIAMKNRQDKKSTANARVFYHTIVVSNTLLTKLTSDIKQLMPARAKEAIDQGAFRQQIGSGKMKQTEDDGGRSKKDDRRKKAAGGKSGGGTQGRETKTKATKNKYKGRKGATHDSDSEDDSQSHQTTNESAGKFPKVEFLTIEALQEEVSNMKELNDCPEELIEEIAADLYQPLTREFQEVVQSAFLATVSVGSDARKKTHQQLQEKVAALITAIRLAEKSIKVFDEEKQLQLKKHLLKTQCSELVNELVLYLADDSLIDFAKEKELSPEMRLKIIKKLSEDTSEQLFAVHKTLSGSTIEDFSTAADEAIAATGIMFKKKDNKKDRQVLSNHRCQLLEQLESSMDAPLTLHLACLVLFQSVTGSMLHASGKFVPHILSHIKNQLPPEKFVILQEYQDLVIKSLTSKDDDTIQSEVKVQLESMAPKVKEIAITFKKSTSISQDAEE